MQQCGNLFLEAYFQFPSVSPCTCPEAWKYQWIILIFSKVTVEDFMANSEVACKILIFIFFKCTFYNGLITLSNKSCPLLT